MPSSEQILAGLAALANDYAPVALGWHGLLAAAVAALVLGWRPPRRIAALLLAMPLVSVSVAAWSVGNPFNGSVFAALSAALAALAWRGESNPVSRSGGLTLATGVALVAFGWAYPHFLTGSPVRYLYEAPFGLVPCPTLSLLTGFALLGGGLGNRAWSLALASAAVFYGAFGAARLGVAIDLLLLAGGITLALVAWRGEKTKARGRGLGGPIGRPRQV